MLPSSFPPSINSSCHKPNHSFIQNAENPSVRQGSQSVRQIMSSSFLTIPDKTGINGDHPRITKPSTSITTPHWHVPVSAAIGGALGGFVCFPFEGLKKKFQSGQHVSLQSLHPRELFRGACSFSCSVTIATIASMTFRHLLQSIPGYNSESTAWEAGIAISGGMLGAVVGSTPVENVILAQQLNKTHPVGAIQILFKQGLRRPWVGLPELACREAGFAGVMLWGGKAANQWALKLSDNQTIATIAEISVAVLGATITHPFDTIATYKQKHDGLVSSRNAFLSIINQEGYRALFRGLSQRIFLFTGCAVIIPRMEAVVHKALLGKHQ